jgi:hypothetical protein|tara:strand:- start:69 stop:512 length:444 start_codon:yes stop_codon:yes gene_type:complete
MAIRPTRNTETREKKARTKNWVPPQQLPDPEPQDGYRFRWVRLSLLGQRDDRNVSVKFREGWVPVKAEEHPEIVTQYGFTANDSGNIESGGLMLCKIPTETAESRNAYYANQNKQQMEAVDNNFLRENNPRMPLFSDKRSTVSRGTK